MFQPKFTITNRMTQAITHIEGTRLTLNQAERPWKGEAVPEADPDDARELLNYRTAFEFVSECLDSGDPIKRPARKHSKKT